MRKLAIVFLLQLLAGALFVSHAQATDEARTTELKAMAKGVVEMLAKEDYQGVFAKLDSGAQKQLPPDKLKEFWTSVISEAGKYQSVQDYEVKQGKIKTGIFMKTRFEKANLIVRVVFNADKQVTGLSIDES
jgi:hypothetical protein